MFKVIKVGEKEVPMLANAATPIRYRQVFGKNLLQYFMGKASEEELAAVTGELAYILARAGEGADMNRLNIDDYIVWLEGFDATAFIDPNITTQIVDLYYGNMDGISRAKKNQGRPKGK